MQGTVPVKVLLADDSITMHRAVALSLKKENVELICCDNGQDGFRLAIEHQPLIVLADLDMPGMTGIELCQAIKAQSSLQNTKVILLCGSFDQVDEGRLESVPADGRLWKPFESHVLITLIQRMLEQGSEPANDSSHEATQYSNIENGNYRENAAHSSNEATAYPSGNDYGQILSTEDDSSEETLHELTPQTYEKTQAPKSILEQATRDLTAEMTKETFFNAREPAVTAHAQTSNPNDPTAFNPKGLPPKPRPKNSPSPNELWSVDVPQSDEQTLPLGALPSESSHQSTRAANPTQVGLPTSPGSSYNDLSTFRNTLGTKPAAQSHILSHASTASVAGKDQDIARLRELRAQDRAERERISEREKTRVSTGTSSATLLGNAPSQMPRTSPSRGSEPTAFAKQNNSEKTSASHALSEVQIRAIVREEIEKAIGGWFQQKLQEKLAQVMAEIDRE